MSEVSDEQAAGPQTMLFGVPLPEGNGLIGWGTLIVLIYTALTLGTGGIDERSIREVVRGTGRLSMLIFLAAYIRPSLSSYPQESLGGWASRNYAKLLLLLGSSHTIHAVAIAALGYLYAPGFDAVTLVVGGLGYALLYLLSILAAAGMLAETAEEEGPIERIASHYVWFVFVITVGTSIAAKPAAALFAALGLYAAYIRYRGVRPASP